MHAISTQLAVCKYAIQKSTQRPTKEHGLKQLKTTVHLHLVTQHKYSNVFEKKLNLYSQMQQLTFNSL